MSPDAEPRSDGPTPDGLTPAERAARRRRLAEIFGDVLPEQTRDDTEVGSGARETDAAEEWLKRQVPPHHG